VSVTEKSKHFKVVEAVQGMCRTLGSGSRLPPHRTLAADLGVTVATLTKAMAELVRRGVVVTRTGSGTFVAGRSQGAVLPVPANGLADLRINVPPVGPVEDMLKVTLRSLEGLHEMFDYEPLGGSEAARAAGVSWLRLRGLDPRPHQVFVVGGGHEGLLAALRSVTRPGDRVLCEALHYVGLRQMANLLQIELVGVPIDGRGLDVEAFSRLCKDAAPKAAVLTPETQNPTTTTLHTAARHAVVAAARLADIMLIEDDIFGHFAGEGEPPLAQLAPERTIYLTSMSKSVAPGLRLGHLMVPDTVAGAVQSTLGALGWTCPALYSCLAERLIVEGTAQLCLEAQRQEAFERAALARQYLGQAITLADDGLNGAKPVYHGWLRLPDGRKADRFVADLIGRQVMVSPAHHFAQTDLPAPEAVRIALGYGSRELLASALQRISLEISQPNYSVSSVA
jgi:DNA-binding transcriptional MocR family regulator